MAAKCISQFLHRLTYTSRFMSSPKPQACTLQTMILQPRLIKKFLPELYQSTKLTSSNSASNFTFKNYPKCVGCGCDIQRKVSTLFPGNTSYTENLTQTVATIQCTTLLSNLMTVSLRRISHRQYHSTPHFEAKKIPKRITSTEPTTPGKVRGIQKDVFPLSTKRVVRRKRTKGAPVRDEEVYDVSAYATAEELKLESLREDLTKQGLYGQVTLPQGECQIYNVLPLPDDVEDALHVEAKYRVDNESREIFFFREGSVVFWNMPLVERQAVLRFLRRHQRGNYDNMLIDSEFEQVEFYYTDNATGLIGDEIQLHKPGVEKDQQHQLEKYAFSNALSLSVKLAIWEASLEKYVDSIEWILEDMKEGRKVNISRNDILRKTGELFTLRHLINLSSDLLDAPDFYWDRQDIEQLYLRTCNYLTIKRRTNVMNEKLNHCCELAELLRGHLDDKHHTRLEVMIIVLILIEVVFEIAKLVKEFISG